MIDKYGFVPNGSRTYYLNRSQPPMFTECVNLYLGRKKYVEGASVEPVEAKYSQEYSSGLNEFENGP